MVSLSPKPKFWHRHRLEFRRPGCRRQRPLSIGRPMLQKSSTIGRSTEEKYLHLYLIHLPLIRLPSLLSSKMPSRIRLGILTPSSNTALEPFTQALITSLNASLPSYNITVHFSRFPVTTISLTPSGLAQLCREHIIAATQLLTYAEVDIIGWSATSAGWLGFDKDVPLCNEVEKAMGIKATTSVLALNKALALYRNW